MHLFYKVVNVWNALPEVMLEADRIVMYMWFFDRHSTVMATVGSCAERGDYIMLATFSSLRWWTELMLPHLCRYGPSMFLCMSIVLKGLSWALSVPQTFAPAKCNLTLDRIRLHWPYLCPFQKRGGARQLSAWSSQRRTFYNRIQLLHPFK